MKRDIGLVAIMAVFLCGLCASATAGECIRFWEPTKRPGVEPDTDGPGSFGELQDTVTLGCLKYAGSIGKGAKEQVLIRDERGKIHRLRVGDYMGENTGVIVKIDRDFIHIRQLVPKPGGGEREAVVKFPKKSERSEN